MEGYKTIQRKIIKHNSQFRMYSLSHQKEQNDASIKLSKLYLRKKIIQYKSHEPKFMKTKALSLQNKNFRKQLKTQKDDIGTEENQQTILPKLHYQHKNKQSIQNLNNIAHSQSNAQKITRFFGPFSRKSLEKHNQDEISNFKIKNYIKDKQQSKINNYIFEGRKSRKKFISKQNSNNKDQEEFWSNVNESLILYTKNNEQQSKDLRQFVENIKIQ